MILHRTDGRYHLEASFEERHAPKAAGFRWDPKAKQWWTNDQAVAARLAQYADAECAAELVAAAQERTATLAASRATDAEIETPAPEGREYMPFQRAGIAFATARTAALIADEMGLGKTIQAIGVVNADDSIRRVLVVCPASLRLNWKREFERWAVKPCDAQIGTTQFWPWIAGDDNPGRVDVVIVGWDSAAKLRPVIDAVAWDLVVVDECHYGKNTAAQRTKAVFGVEPKGKGDARTAGDPGIVARRKLALSGTPITNRPAEIFAALRWLDSATWPKFFAFGRRYCSGFEGRWGWDFSGASHLDELQDRLRSSLMIRRTKAEVLTDLPAKRRQVIEMPANGAQGAVDAENEAWGAREEALQDLRTRVEAAKACESAAEYKAAVDALQEATRAAFTEISRLRHETAVAKAPHVAAHVVDLIEGGVEKVVVMAHHHDVIEIIRAAMPVFQPVVLTGETPMVARQAAVDRFQTNPDCRVFIGSITAAGVGLTLTAAAHVVFAELDWVPGNVTQAEDRCHRIGQTDSVLVQHLVLEGSLDARMAQILVKKQAVIDQALDAEVDARALYAVPEEIATASTSRKKIEADAATMTVERIAAIHAGLQALARMCDGAHEIDGAGFSKMDTRLGKSLAYLEQLTPKQAALGAKLVNRYRRQLSEALVASAKGQEVTQ